MFDELTKLLENMGNWLTALTIIAGLILVFLVIGLYSLEWYIKRIFELKDENTQILAQIQNLLKSQQIEKNNNHEQNRNQ